MNISELDSNFTLPKIERTDIEWIDVQNTPDVWWGENALHRDSNGFQDRESKKL